jgi:hypothetical protein
VCPRSHRTLDSFIYFNSSRLHYMTWQPCVAINIRHSVQRQHPKYDIPCNVNTQNTTFRATSTHKIRHSVQRQHPKYDISCSVNTQNTTFRAASTHKIRHSVQRQHPKYIPCSVNTQNTTFRAAPTPKIHSVQRQHPKSHFLFITLRCAKVTMTDISNYSIEKRLVAKQHRSDDESGGLHLFNTISFTDEVKNYVATYEPL